MRKFRLLWLLLFLCSSGLTWAQNRTISGRVTDTSNINGIPGVTVTAKGTSIGVSTDQDGRFSISVPQNVRALIFSSVGFGTREVAIQGNTVNVSLTQASSALNEVIVTTGYQTLQRRRFAGSSVAVDIDAVRTQPLASFDQALQGSAPGINVTANSGQPGAAATVRIRGTGSLNGGNTPLYVVDGIRVNAADFSSLNQGDFERVEVLKDASALSLYGSEGANGVIVISTRKGRAGRVRVNYDVQYGRSTLPKDRLEIMNSREKIDYEIDNGNPFGWSTTPGAGGRPSQADSLRNVNFDWQDALFHTGNTTQHMVSASGGSEATRFFASLSYLNQEGIVRNTGLKRYTGRINVDNVTGNLKLGMNLQIGYSDFNNTSETNTAISSPLNAARWSNPYERDFNPNTRDYQQLGGLGRLTSGQPNGAMELFLNRRSFPQLKGVGNAYAEFAFPFVKGLSIRTNWGLDYTQNEEETFIDRRTVTGQNNQGANGRLTRGFGRTLRYQGTSSLNYRTKFGEDHDLDASIFYEVIKAQFRGFNFNGFGLNNFFTNETGITAGTSTNGFIPSVGGSGGPTNGILSYFGIVNYGFKNRYFLNLTYRTDFSSRFGRENRRANFASAGVVWNVMNERFMANTRFINELRVRASYGSTGNQISPAGNFGSLPLLSRGNYNGLASLVPLTPGNPELGWERNISTNFGIDFALLSNRISGSIDLYNRETKDLFVNPPTSITAGSPTGDIPSNFGRLRNRGIETALKVDVIRNRNFRWTLEGNLTYNQNRVVELLTDSVPQGLTMLKEGLPNGSLFLVKYAGVNPQTGAPQYFDKDGKITETYDPNNRQFLGTLEAPWFGGFGTTVAYKGFELNVQFNYFAGRQIYNNDLLNLMEPTYFTDNLSRLRLREWRNPGDQTDVPGFNYTVLETVQNSTFFVEDGDFIRLRNVQLRYSFGRPVLNKLKLQALSVFVQGQNLWTATKFRGFDPEVVGNLIGAQYPAMVQGTIGLNVGF